MLSALSEGATLYIHGFQAMPGDTAQLILSLSSAEKIYYIHMPEGGVYAYPESLLEGEPLTDYDGTLQLMLYDGQEIRYTADAYISCTQTQPELPFFTSFKFNNKYNLHLHQDVEVADSLLVPGIGRTFTLVLNAIGKRLTPSFKTNDKSAVVFADGLQIISKETRLRFDRDIIFTVSYPQYVKLTGVDNGHLIWEPFGNDYIVHTEWLTDNPNNVPRIDIHIDNGQTVKDKVTYLHADFHLSGNGVYEDLQEEVWIRGRGNFSWTWPKKPYRLKFDKKVKPFGLTGGKSWILLANYLRSSMIANPIAMKMAQLIGTPFPNHIIPVELYINDVYQGSYQFTEKVGFGANSIDGDAEKGYLLEFDAYYDEPYRFRSTPYDLPVNIKEPDFNEWESETREERFNDIREETNALMSAISRKSDEVNTLLDVPSFVRNLIIWEYTNNHEIDYPKSIFAYKEDINDPDRKLTFGPIWDYDFAYGADTGGNYWRFPTEYAPASWASKGSVNFRNDIKSMGVVQYHYYKIWSDFMHGSELDELCEFVKDYYTFARVSFEHNASKWDDGKGYAGEIVKAQNWLRTRADYIYKKQPVFDISDYDTLVEGDVNGDGRVTVTDAFLVFSYLMGGELDDFNVSRADVNYDQKTNIADVTCIVRRALTAARFEENYATIQAPVSTASLRTDDFEAPLGEWVDIPVGITSSEDLYQALQFDITLPDGLVLDSVLMRKEIADSFTLTTHAFSGSRIRIMLMPRTSDDVLPTQLVTLRVQSAQTTRVTERIVVLQGGCMTTVGGEEHRLRGLAVSFEQTTGLRATSTSSLHVTGGKQITITALEEQNVTITSIDGRKVQTVHVLSGENVYDVPSGIYIVAGKKVVVL